MNSFRKSLNKNPIFKFLSSIKITVVCLFLLFILTFWGTVAQMDIGLLQAQERYFHSFFFYGFGFLPFPGAQLVLWVLFINLVSVSITRFVYKLSHLGILITHIGLLTYFIAAFLTLHVVEESNVTLLEGEKTNLSKAYHKWELSIWTDQEGNKRNIIAYDMDDLKSGDALEILDYDIKVVPILIYENATAYKTEANNLSVYNASGISALVEESEDIEPEKNKPGLVFEVQNNNEGQYSVLLYSAENQPTKLTVENKNLYFKLRRKRFQLPFEIELQDFDMEVYPGTDIPKHYESTVTIDHENVKRKTLIWMNHPLRFKEYTFYQAAYSIDHLGQYRSTLAVVKNTGRILPYISSLLTFIGLMIHFLFMGFFRKKK